MSEPAAPAGSEGAGVWSILRPLVPFYALDVLTAFTVGMVPPLLPLLAVDWGLPPVEVGLVNTVYALGRLAASYPASWLRERVGTRAAVFLGLAALVTGVVGCGLAPSFPLFLAGRLLMGVGASGAFLAVFAELLESAPLAWRGRLTNGFEAMAILSLAVGGLLGATIAGGAGWRPVFIGAGPVLALTLGVWPFVHPARGRRRAAVVPARGPAPPAGRGRLWPVYAASFTLSLTWSGLFATLVPLVGSGRYGLGSSALGLALGAGYLAELLGLFGVGAVIDRVRREPVFLAGAAAVAAGGLVLATGSRPVAFVAALVLVGGGFAVWMIPATVLADRVGTPMPPGRLATYRIALDAGMITGPLLLGGLASLAGERGAVGAAGLLLVAGALVLGRR